MLLMCNCILPFHQSDTEQGPEEKTLSSRPKQQNEMRPFLFRANKRTCKLKNTFDTINLPPTQNSDISFHRNHLCKLCSSCCHEYNEPQTNLSCAVMAYFHRHANTSQNCLSPAIKSETRLKTGSSVEQKFYVDHHSWVFFFSGLQRCWRWLWWQALINLVEMCFRATGDTGTGIKLGQCQTLQPWLSLFLSENTFFFSH